MPALWLLWRLLRGRPRSGRASIPPRPASSTPGPSCSRLSRSSILSSRDPGRALGPAWSTGFLILFVLLGDFRVFLLVCFLAGGQRALRPALREAALLTPVVGTFAFSVYRIAGAAAGSVDRQLLWLVYELGFLGMLFFLRREVITARSALPPTPREAWLRRVTFFVGVYYVSWAACDVLILPGSTSAGRCGRSRTSSTTAGWFPSCT